ncbi:MAG: Ger(x)C family spore germination protein [Dethiobacter sp.]|nr:Ger(x)C family spore germination protein [Dethiobacter sp.]
MGKRLLLLLAAGLLFLTGCWSRVEIEQLAIVRCLAIDYLAGQQEPHLVTLAVARPAAIPAGDGGGGTGGGAVQVFSGTGASLELALSNAALSLPRYAYFTHNEVVLIGEEAARRGLQETVDLVFRFHQMRLNNLLLLVPGIAHNVLLASGRLEAALPEEILGLLEQARLRSEGDPLEVYHILRQTVTEGQEAHLAVLRLEPPPELALPEIAAEKKPAGGQGGGAGAGQREEAAPPPEVLSMDGTAVFRNDKLAGFLTPRETRGYLLLAGRIRRGQLTVPDPLVPDKSVNLGILRGKSNITPRLEAGRLSFLVEAELEGDLLSQESPENLSTPEMLEKLGAAKEHALKAEMEQTLRRLQEMEADLVGFGTILWRQNPQAFRELADRWPQVFRHLEVEIRVQAHLRRTGLLSRPVPVLR